MQGEPSVDRIMRPLSDMRWSDDDPPPKFSKPSTAAWNRIYEAVMRGNEAQGRKLVQAVVDYIEANRVQRVKTPEEAVRTAMRALGHKNADWLSAGDVCVAANALIEIGKHASVQKGESS